MISEYVYPFSSRVLSISPLSQIPSPALKASSCRSDSLLVLGRVFEFFKIGLHQKQIWQDEFLWKKPELSKKVTLWIKMI